jgi:hypothetical protein
MMADNIVEALVRLRLPDTFNPYTDTCAVHDLANAPELRRENLCQMLSSALAKGVDSIWVGRELGHRGGRRTGIPLTDERTMPSTACVSRMGVLRKVTNGPAMGEATATAVWRALAKLQQGILLWNIFPLHSYDEGNELSNRAHRRVEAQACEHILGHLILAAQPRLIVALGAEAETALNRSGHSCVRVRHPSHGGQRKFLADVGNIYSAVLT